MTTIIIPKRVTKGEELVVIPRREYEEYLNLRQIVPIVKMNLAEKRKWKEAKKDYKQGKYVTLEQLVHELDIANKRKS